MIFLSDNLGDDEKSPYEVLSPVDEQAQRNYFKFTSRKLTNSISFVNHLLLIQCYYKRKPNLN